MYIKRVAEEMQRGHASSLEAQGSMLKLLDKYLLGGEVPDNLISHLSLYLITKFHKSLLAFRLLVVSGFDEDASVILRTLVEADITLKFISKDPEERAVKFIEYEYIAKHRLLKMMEKYYPTAILDEGRREQILQDYQANKHKYPKGHQWFEMSLSTMATQTDMSYWYETVYQPDSSYVHSNISAAMGFIRTDEDEGLLLAVGPVVFNATDIIAKSCELSLLILNTALENMAYSTDDLESTWKDVESLLSKEFKEKGPGNPD